VDNVTEYFDVAIYQVRAGAARSPVSHAQPKPLAPRVLETDELTILTGWAQAFAEALTYEPECVEALLADARGSTSWRAMFGIPELSPRLSQALSFISQAAREVASLSGNVTRDALHISCLENRPAENALDRLSCRVLQSTLEQVRTR
jgi:hypothetical protein